MSTRAYDVMAPTCSSRVVLHRIGARWTVFVVTALADGPMRFTALKAHIQGITPKVLTETLRALHHDGLVDRIDRGGQPPHVEYALTELGRSLLVPLAAVREWAETHVPDVEAANARTDRGRG
ncbi:helix-turn-helix domain-containing protein [uncultured Williamsia sp.]|uniref:winged helix-turn-helix transcriptional regulator n=1 Tax=uncultured Williamsia sp. TaxID=259311 RepID=UPI002624622B|nr:helix-turn-helix domain-containing protein [uncultured Williamsia sp.]